MIRRFNSQSTGRTTLVGSDHGLVSPVSPLAAIDRKLAQSPIIHTSLDNKQWVDLDYLPPKLLRELRRQYDPSEKDESLHPIAKGTSRVKAWARQSKRGIEIRLRRKLNDQNDEVTDIRFVPEPLPDLDVKLPLVPELPTYENEICELADTSTPGELGTEITGDFSRTSTGSMDSEPLPIYEARNTEPPDSVIGRAQGPQPSASPPSPVFHRRTSSQFSIVATPKRGLSPKRASPGTLPETTHSDGTDEASTLDLGVEARNPNARDVQALQAGLERANSQLQQERQARERFESLLNNVRDELTAQRQNESTAKPSDDGRSVLKGLKVTRTTRYETETDVEPPSPSEHRSKQSLSGKKPIVNSKRKKTSITGRSPKVPSRSSSSVGDSSKSHRESLVERQPTLPKRTPATAGIQEVWSALLRSQAKLIGPEHQLTYQAKFDLARSRANPKATRKESRLAALRMSKTLAVQLLGTAHPLVAAFSADLATLEGLLSCAESEDESDSNIEFASNPVQMDDTLSSSDTAAQPQVPASPASVVPQGNYDKTHRQSLPLITTTFHPVSKMPSPVHQDAQSSTSADPWVTLTRPHQPRNEVKVLLDNVFSAMLNVALNAIQWLQCNCGPEQPVEPGKVRVRWTCACGQLMHDDFVERRPGAARALEAYLNRPRMHTGGTPVTPSSSYGSRSFTGSSIGGVPSANTSWSSYGFQQGSPVNSRDTKSPETATGMPFQLPFFNHPEPPWLLTCANEDRYTPKLAHLDMGTHTIRSDKDLAMSLRNHYFNVNKKWWRVLKLRGLATIEFVQFEVHQNRFADIRKSPDMPLLGQDYTFEPGDLMPPVGSHYLLHLFKHPEDYDGELITYLRAPKKNARLNIGRGWGISLVEGFEAGKVWLMVSMFFALASLVFAIAWAWKRHDVQGAFGVAAWICTLAVLLVGWLQATLG